MRVAVFGGSFDPPHNDHARIVKYLAEGCDIPFDLIVVAIVDDGTHAHGKQLSPYGHRCEMVREMLSDTLGPPREDVVIARQTQSLSADYLRALHTELPEKGDIYFVVGGDIVNDLDRWERWDEVLELSTPLIITRPGYPHTSKYIQREIVSEGISSTMVRAGTIPFLDVVPPSVAQYIMQHMLYGYS